MKTPERSTAFPTIAAPFVARPKTAMRGSASVAWLALIVSLCAIALLFWRPVNMPLIGSGAAPQEPAAATTEQSVEPKAAAGLSVEEAQLSTRVAALEDVLPDVKSTLEHERALRAEVTAEREQLRLLYQQTIEDSVALAALDIEPLLDQAQSLLADGSPIQAPISVLKAARDRAARAQSASLKPLIDALDHDREVLQVIAQRSVRKAADDLHRLALGLKALPLQSQAGAIAQKTESATEPAATSGSVPTPATTAAAADKEDAGWLDRLVKSSSELIELPDAAQRERLVRVTEVGAPDLGVLSPAAPFFLIENLRLRLLSARLSLLMHDRAGFDADRQRALQWMQDHFDQADERNVKAVSLLTSLESMGRPSVDVSLATSREALLKLTPTERAR